MNQIEETQKELDNIAAFITLVKEEHEEESHLSEIEADMNKLKTKIDAFEIRVLLSEKYDTYNCIMTLNSGAGGTDAQDWTQMLLRMYLRWLEKKQFQYEIADANYGDEAGLKSATLLIQGEYAFGYLKPEVGVHRLVRLSPFNANNKRQTSFAAIDVIPQLDANFSNIELDPKDLRIETYRAQGAGGQHINKTDSAVRITHIPTGIIAQSQNARSQISNRETALHILKSRILQKKEAEHQAQINTMKSDSDIAWGNQIRSYVFHPYKLVKDLRTEVETSDVTSVMDGELDPFIHAYLRTKI